jgi:sugar phosphate isomerase/epimerase
MQRFRLGAVTDVFSPDVAAAAARMRELGLKGAELRTINGRNILEATSDDLTQAIAALKQCELEVVAIASPNTT